MDEDRTNKGTFAKGNTVGKKRASKKAAHRQSVLAEILHEADGDAVKVKELMLKRGDELELDINTVLRLAKELAPFQNGKKSSIDIKTDDVKTINIVYDYSNPQEIAQNIIETHIIPE